MITNLLPLTMQNNPITSDTCQQVRNFAVSVSSTQHPMTNSRHKAKWDCKGLMLLLTMIVASVQQSIGQTTETFNNTLSGTDQSYTFTVPQHVTSITVQVWGGGGGGGGNSSSSNVSGGGGGGAYSSSTITGLTPGTPYTVHVGQNGIYTYGVAGGNGGDSWFGSAATVMAKGGTGGGAGTSGAGTAGTGGASASGYGSTKYSGGNGGAGRSNSSGTGGGGGSSAGTGVIGNNGTAGGSSAGAGGGAPTGGAAGGNGGAANGNGAAGSIPGGGGGGSGDHDPDGGNGGAGAVGRVSITYTPIPAPAITVFSPTSACAGLTPSVNITGTNFTGATAVTFNGLPASSFSVTDAGHITATLPSGAATGPIAVTTIGGTGTSSTNFIVSGPVASSSQTNITCFGINNGTITVVAGGGVSPYTFSVDNGTTWLPATGTDLCLFTGLLPNTPYRIRVRDNTGCTSPIIP